MNEYYGGTIPWLKSGELNDSSIKTSEEYITEEGLQNSSARIFAKGTVLLALYGATVGKVGILDISASTNQAICGITPKSNLLNPKFIMYYLLSKRNYLRQKAFGGAQPNISQRIVRNLEVPVPSLIEQNAIVKLVENTRQRIGKTKLEVSRIPDLTRRLRMAILSKAFQGELTDFMFRTSPRSDEWIKVALASTHERRKKIKSRLKHTGLNNRELPILPKNWSWIQIHDIADLVQYGTSIKMNDDVSGIPVLRMGNIRGGKIVFDDLKYLPSDWPEREDYLLRDGDILFNRTNSAELVGKSAVFHGEQDVMFASYLIRVRTLTEFYLHDLLCHYINSPLGRKYIDSVRTQQVGQANVNGTKLVNMPVPFIPIEEQKVMLGLISKVFSHAQLIEKQAVLTMDMVTGLENSILRDAFLGKLAIPMAYSDDRNTLSKTD